jgi:GntR family carbon starvation induced transcriptional regulator
MLKLVESNRETAAAKSQASTAYTRLKADVLSGRVVPGERLKISELAASLEVSPGAIREALSRLVPEQLVVAIDQKGFIVAPLSIEDLEELTDLRCEIEAIALRRSVARADPEWEVAILGAAHRLRRTPVPASADTSAEWMERHDKFHAALVSGCGNRRLLELHAQLFQQSNRYRSMTLSMGTGRNLEAEHQALVDAALDHNADLLVDLTTRHFRETTALIVGAARRQKSSGNLT